MSNLNQKILLKTPLRLPPTKEQRRIVDALDSYLTRLDDATASLERAQRNLKRYRASVLQAAVEGRLVPTEAELAREQGREFEPASVLLERILAERRRRWEEAELAKMEAKGRAPKNDKWKAKYKEPVAPDTSDLPELPEGWCWSTVDQLSCEVKYGSSAKCSAELVDGVPVLRMGNIIDGRLDYENLKFLPTEHDEFPDLLLQEGDLVFNRTNSAELVGKSAVFRDRERPVSFASYLIRVRFLGGVAPEFLAAFINSQHGRLWIASVVTQQVGQANVNGTKLKACRVPLPPAAEQERVVIELDRLSSVTDSLISDVQRESARCDRLRQSILKWAFEGKLVDQDPNDEPASELLARIQAEREATAKPKRTRRRSKKTTKNGAA